MIFSRIYFFVPQAFSAPWTRTVWRLRLWILLLCLFFILRRLDYVGFLRDSRPLLLVGIGYVVTADTKHACIYVLR